jgi:hypothetical protein
MREEFPLGGALWCLCGCAAESLRRVTRQHEQGADGMIRLRDGRRQTMQEWITRTFDLLCQKLHDGEVADRLKSDGCPPIVAEKIVALLPLACGRAMLADTGVSFSATFRCMGADGTVSGPQSLSSEPLWSMIQGFVATQRTAKPDGFSFVARRSAEFDAVNKAALNGSKLADLVGSDPIFLFVEPTIEPKNKKAFRWAFWR